MKKEKKKTIEKLHEIYDAHKDSFSGGLHDVLWQLMINKTHEEKTKALTPIMGGGYSLGLAIMNERGYIPTPAHFKGELTYDDCADICDKLNKKLFDLCPLSAAEVVMPSMRPIQ